MATIGLTPVLQTYSILAVALAAGTNLSTSIITLPALLHASPPTLATQWKILYDSGITPVVSLAMSSGLGFATLAYRAAHPEHLTKLGILSNARRNLYVGAALAAFGLAPYTRVLMMGTIEELAGRAEGVKGKGGGKGEGEGEGDGEGKHSTHELVREWGRYNLARGVLLLASAGFGTWASVGRG